MPASAKRTKLKPSSTQNTKSPTDKYTQQPPLKNKKITSMEQKPKFKKQEQEEEEEAEEQEDEEEEEGIEHAENGESESESFVGEDDNEMQPEEHELEQENSADDDDSDSDDEAPEAVSTKTAKEDALSASKRAREIHLQTLANAKQRRREADLKLKKQHEEKLAREAKKEERAAKKQKRKEAREESLNQQKSTADAPQLLPPDILAQLAEEEKSCSGNHVRLDEDSSEEEESRSKEKRKQKSKGVEDKSRTVGSFKVVALSDLTEAAPPIATSILSFREAHFYGGRVKRMDPILNISQRRSGAALQFARQDSAGSKRKGMGIAEANPAPRKKKNANPI